MDKNRRGVFRSTPTGAIHRSTHSTNAGGTSFRTIMTRKIRSSRNSVAMPSRAAAMVGYRAHASAMPLADPRLIVGISLNITLGAKYRLVCRSGLRRRNARVVTFLLLAGDFSRRRLLIVKSSCLRCSLAGQVIETRVGDDQAVRGAV